MRDQQARARSTHLLGQDGGREFGAQMIEPLLRELDLRKAPRGARQYQQRSTVH